MSKKEKYLMILIIDTTCKDEIKLGLDDNIKTMKTEKQSEDILSDIDNILRKENKKLQDITTVLVNNQAGSYTGTRIGVTIANTLAWTLDIPVIPYQDDNLHEMLKRAKLSTDRFTNIVVVDYEPDKRNI